MTLAVSRLSISTGALLTPDAPNEAIQRALNVVRVGRIVDAIGLIQKLPHDTPLDRAWKNYFDARIRLEQGDFARARSLARRAASESLPEGLAGPKKSNALRLAAAAMETEGVSLRRQDQPVEASRIHQAAYALRQEAGTPDEQTESAISIGYCAEWTGDFPTAERWFRTATNVSVVGVDQARSKSSALVCLSTLLSRLQRHDEATQAAQAAQNLLLEFIPGDIAAISAGLHTTQSMIRHAEHLLGEHGNSACLLLEDTSQLLKSTHENLSGFGQSAHKVLDWCEEQTDYVERLRKSLGLPPMEPKQA